MINPDTFIDWLAEAGITKYVGVPDSLLKSIALTIDSHPQVEHHVIAANEGAAVGFAVGVYLESAKPAAVYLQNSGLGNAVNPLTALAHRDVYGVPMVLIIGWRGEPGRPDEPQHIVQGRITRELLDIIDVPFVVLDQSSDATLGQVRSLVQSTQDSPGPVAIIVPAGTFDTAKATRFATSEFPLTREEALFEVLSVIPEGDRIIATTGMLGRELWEIRKKSGQPTQNDFLVVGGMGHASAIAHGVATANPDATVWCLDGDGSLIMHLGSLAVIGNTRPRNLKHIIFNNYSHDSVGGQATAASSVDFEGLCRSIQYGWVGSTANRNDIHGLVHNLADTLGPALLELKVKKGARSNLGRPPTEVFTPGTHFSRKSQ